MRYNHKAYTREAYRTRLRSLKSLMSGLAFQKGRC